MKTIVKSELPKQWAIIVSHLCINLLQVSNSTVVLFSRIHPKVAHAPKTVAHEKHPANILHEEKHAHGIVLALLKLNIVLK